jgi:hypothetical protein
LATARRLHPHKAIWLDYSQQLGGKLLANHHGGIFGGFRRKLPNPQHANNPQVDIGPLRKTASTE